MLVAECSDNCFDDLERDEGCLFAVAFLDLLLQVFSVSADQLHEFLVLRGMAEERDGFLANRQVLFLVGGGFGEELIGRGWGCAHEEVGRVAVSEDLGELLEVKLIVLSDVDEGEEVFKLLVLGKWL